MHAYVRIQCKDIELNRQTETEQKLIKQKQNLIGKIEIIEPNQ